MFTPRLLAQRAIPLAPGVAIYTVPVGTVTIIQTIDVCNTLGGAQTVRIHVVAAGGVPTVDNALFYNTSIAASGTLNYTGPLNMDIAGMFLWVSAGALGLTITVSGLEQT